MKNKAVDKWIEMAEKDLRLIEMVLSKGEEDLWDILCFHAQQAAEKYLKGYLTFKGVRVKKTHDIRLLIEECIKIDKDFEELKKMQVDRLTFYAVASRYPDSMEGCDIEEARQAYKLAKKVREFVLKKIEE